MGNGIFRFSAPQVINVMNKKDTADNKQQTK